MSKRGGIAETSRLHELACYGIDGDGEPLTWRFSGQPTIMSVPKPRDQQSGDSLRQKWSAWPEVFVRYNDKWLTETEAAKELGFYRSKLPGWHPVHTCGMFCDGQDGTGECRREKLLGPPAKTPIQQLTEEVWHDD